MNPIHTVKALSASFPAAEKRVADYIVTHADQIPFLSVHAIAQAVGVNAASVSRMAHRAGFATLRELKVALARETVTPISAVHQAIDLNDSDSQVIRKIFGTNIQSLEDTLKALSLDDLAKAAKAIVKARGGFFFGEGISGCLAQDVALRLTHLGLSAEACADGYQMLVRAVQLTKGKVAIGISHSGRSTSTVHALECARKSGALTIGISNCLQSPLQEASSIFFCTATRDTSFEATALSAGVARMCLIDALYVLVAKHLPASGRIKQVNQAVENFCRIPQRKKTRCKTPQHHPIQDDAIQHNCNAGKRQPGRMFD